MLPREGGGVIGGATHLLLLDLVVSRYSVPLLIRAVAASTWPLRILYRWGRYLLDPSRAEHVMSKADREVTPVWLHSLLSCLPD